MSSILAPKIRVKMSKSKALGHIILGFRCIPNMKSRFPGIISKAAEALGVSRKSGYKAAKALRKAEKLSESRSSCAQPQSRELALLRIRNQILTYRVEHPEIDWATRGKHLPEDAKRLCVRILRDFKEKLSLGDIATAIGIPSSTLSRWNSQAGEDCRFPCKPERRGTSRHVTPEQAQRVIELYESLKENVTLEEFTNRWRELYPEEPLDRRTITKILRASGHYKSEPKRQSKPYRGKFSVYFPGAQASLDGKEITVRFTKEPRQSVTVVNEVAIDIASRTILGEVLGSAETACGVKEVTIKANRQCTSLLAYLADHRSSNRAGEAVWTMEEHSELGAIFTFPYHPWTNGHIEGLFGLFSKAAGDIEIDDTSRQSLAESIVKIVWRIFTYFHNNSPRKRLDGKSPLQYLKSFTVPAAEVARARQRLRAQKKRSEGNRRPTERLSDPSFRRLVAGILKEHGFEDCGLDHALKSLVHFDTAVIESASSSFSAYSKRDGFQESKRTFAYFMGIVRNKQKQLDQSRRNAAADVLNAQRLFDQIARQEELVEKERRQEQEELRTEPQRVVMRYASLLMKGSFKRFYDLSLQGIRKGLRALLSLGKTTAQIFESLKLAVQALPQFSEEIKDRMISLLSEEVGKLR